MAASVTHPPESSNGGGRSSHAFDTNMVIILAALLCALIFALGLNSIVRCAMRFSRTLSSFNSTATSVSSSTGLKKNVLRQIPVAVYHANLHMSSAASDCPICLGEFSEGDRVRVLPRCHHGFHVACIDKWLAAHSSCPTCRQSLLLLSSDAVPGFHGSAVAETAIIVDEVS